jgi:hypothetical protein
MKVDIVSIAVMVIVYRRFFFFLENVFFGALCSPIYTMGAGINVTAEF